MQEKIRNYIQQHKGEIVDTLKELIRIPPVRGEAEDNAPFGKECARVLEFTQRLYESNGFGTELDIDESGIVFCTIPYKFNFEATRITVFEGDEKRKMLRYIDSSSEIIKDPQRLDNYFNGWAYLHKWVPQAPSNYFDLKEYNSSGNYNLISCESHLSQAKKVLEFCFLDRVAEAKEWSEKIKELTVMPV